MNLNLLNIYLILTLLLDNVDGFATTQLMGALLPVFHKTYFHDVQTEIVICQLQQEYFKIYNRSSECPSLKWLTEISPLKYSSAHEMMITMGDFSALPDLESPMKMDPTYHFDNTDFIDPTNMRLIHETEKIISTLKHEILTEESLTRLRTQTGLVLHTLQDFYSHTNWIEAGFDGIAENIGINNTFKVEIKTNNDGDNCKKCDTVMTDEEREYLVKIEDDPLIYLPLLAAGWSSDNVYVCRDNIVSYDKLHSGYYGGEVSQTKSGQCSHGGGMDSSSSSLPTGGINKDSDSLLFSPHYYLHKDAAERSMSATVAYLNFLRDQVGHIKWGRFLGLEHPYKYHFKFERIKVIHDFINLPINVKLIKEDSYCTVRRGVTVNVTEGKYEIALNCPDCQEISMVTIQINDVTSSFIPVRIVNNIRKNLWKIGPIQLSSGDKASIKSVKGLGLNGMKTRYNIGYINVK